MVPVWPVLGHTVTCLSARKRQPLPVSFRAPSCKGVRSRGPGKAFIPPLWFICQGFAVWVPWHPANRLALSGCHWDETLKWQLGRSSIEQRTLKGMHLVAAKGGWNGSDICPQSCLWGLTVRWRAVPWLRPWDTRDSGLSFATDFLRAGADQLGVDAPGIWATGSCLYLLSGSVTLTVSGWQQPSINRGVKGAPAPPLWGLWILFTCKVLGSSWKQGTPWDLQVISWDWYKIQHGKTRNPAHSLIWGTHCDSSEWARSDTKSLKSRFGVADE